MVALLMAREAVRLGRDVMMRSGAVPSRLADVDAAYLSTLMARSVTAARPSGETRGTTDRATLALEGTDVPSSVFVKTAPAALGTRFFGNLAHLGKTEVGFYRDLRSRLNVEAPQCFGFAYDDPTGRFMLVLEDLASRGAQFPDVLDALSPDQAAGALDTLAQLHAEGAELLDRRTVTLPWLGLNSTDPMLGLVARVLPSLARKVRKRRPDLVPDTAYRMLGDYRRIAGVLDAGRHVILHGDPHPGNTYLVDGRVGLLDWQAVRQGNPFRDVAYLLILGLPVDIRRAHDRELLTHYVEAMAAGGIDFAPDEPWQLYRAMTVYAYVAAVFTAGLGGLQGATLADEGLQRAAAALADLEGVAAVA